MVKGKRYMIKRKKKRKKTEFTMGLVLIGRIFILVSLYINGSLQVDNIRMLDYKQEDSSTSCTRGLISGVDTVGFKFRVEYSGEGKANYVQLQIMRKSDHKFKMKDHVDIQSCCNGTTNADCKRIGSHTVEITFRVKASLDLNGARVLGILLNPYSPVTPSEEHIFPDISESTNSSYKMFFNGQKFTDANISRVFDVTGHNFEFTFNCKSQADPCLIEILDDTMKIVRGKDVAVYSGTLKNEKEVNVTVKYAACTFGGHFLEKTFTFKRDLNMTEEISFNTDFLVPTLLAVFFAIILVILALCYVNKKFKILKTPGVVRRKHVEHGEEIPEIDKLCSSNTRSGHPTTREMFKETESKGGDIVVSVMFPGETEKTPMCIIIADTTGRYLTVAEVKKQILRHKEIHDHENYELFGEIETCEREKLNDNDKIDVYMKYLTENSSGLRLSVLS